MRWEHELHRIASATDVECGKTSTSWYQVTVVTGAGKCWKGISTVTLFLGVLRTSDTPDGTVEVPGGKYDSVGTATRHIDPTTEATVGGPAGFERTVWREGDTRFYAKGGSPR